jgi:hypothetical protein
MSQQVDKQSGANISRRVFLQKLSQAIGSVAAGALLAGSGMSVALAYTPNPDSASKPGLLFTKKQMQALRDICDTILPETDTKSAAQVDCHGFVDHQLVQCHSAQQQQQCVDAVELVIANAQASFGEAFTDLSFEQRTELLRDIEALKAASAEQKGQFKFLKSLIVFGYFTSEEGVTKALSFQPYPGGFKGSIPVNAETKSWGSLNYY